jgi:hypothetical protein
VKPITRNKRTTFALAIAVGAPAFATPLFRYLLKTRLIQTVYHTGNVFELIMFDKFEWCDFIRVYDIDRGARSGIAKRTTMLLPEILLCVVPDLFPMIRASKLLAEGKFVGV